MKLCQPHWSDLRAAIADRGLTHLVSPNGEAAAARIQAQLQPGEPERAGFDPLLNANFAIWNNALESGGLYLMTGSPDGSEYCPLCELEANTPEKAATWIGYAADEQLNAARSLGLAPGVQ